MNQVMKETKVQKAHDDAAMFRSEFERIVEQIDHDLRETILVPRHGGEGSRDVLFDAHAFLFDRQPVGSNDFLHHRRQVDLVLCERHFSRLNFRQVQQIGH